MKTKFLILSIIVLMNYSCQYKVNEEEEYKSIIKGQKKFIESLKKDRAENKKLVYEMAAKLDSCKKSK